MKDKELLELAAKAAGIDVSHFCKERKAMVVFAVDENENPDSDYWNPLTDDGDALRLAVKLQIIVGKYDDYANAGGIGNDVDITVWAHEEADPYAATRRAIVRAAAEIGLLTPNAKVSGVPPQD